MQCDPLHANEADLDEITSGTLTLYLPRMEII
jgi:hypothetical protein